LLAAVYKVTDVSYFSYIFSKAVKSVILLWGKCGMNFKFLTQSINQSDFMVSTSWINQYRKNAVECGRSTSLEKSNWQIQNCFWNAGLSHEQFYSCM